MKPISLQQLVAVGQKCLIYKIRSLRPYPVLDANIQKSTKPRRVT
ncbi:MAG: hypothetical protein WBA13_16335 [Microcoleaceae cyanobacterium]